MLIEIPLYDGFDELDAIGPFEVLANAGLAGCDVDVRLVRLGSRDPVTGAHGLVVTPAGAFSGAADIIVVPGGGWIDGGPGGAGAREQVRSGELPSALASAHAAGAVVASVCTGGMLLAAAGITNGRPATTHHGALEDLRTSGARVVDARVVDDGDLVTAGGVTSGIDLALWLVEREFGAGLADGIARLMEHERRGPVWRADAADTAA